jgi:SAM-dependent methyltransferase
MGFKLKKGLNYDDPKVRKEILDRHRRGLWTPEQIDSFASHFKLKRGMRLLDAGCGYGYSLRTYGPYCLPDGKFTGLDINYNLIIKARTLAVKEHLGKYSQFVNGNVYRLPFTNNTFDISIAQVVLCHLNRPEQALDELIRVTKRKGCVAIFDNAIEGGGRTGWNNAFKPTIADDLFRYKISLHMKKGKIRMGEIDFNIGCYLPGWMEKRGLKNIDVRCNERVQWMAPPYRSPAQKTLIRNMKERIKDKELDTLSSIFKHNIRRLRAGGADNAMIKRYIRDTKRRSKIWIEAMHKGRVSSAYSYGGFWCVWGFKP